MNKLLETCRHYVPEGIEGLEAEKCLHPSPPFQPCPFGGDCSQCNDGELYRSVFLPETNEPLDLDMGMIIKALERLEVNGPQDFVARFPSSWDLAEIGILEMQAEARSLILKHINSIYRR